MQNLDKPNVATPETYLNIGSGFNLLVGGVYRLIIGALGTGGMTNASKVSIGETWGTIASTWGNETQTWEEASQLIGNIAKPTTTTYGIVDSFNALPVEYETFGLTIDGIGQSFIGNGKKLDYLYLKIGKSGYPSGQIYARIYSATNTSGVENSSIPVGEPLAVSLGVDATTIETGSTYKNTRFTFNGSQKIILSNTTEYILTLEYVATPTSTDLIRYVYREYKYDGYPSHSGNACYRDHGTQVWSYNTENDLYFTVYYEDESLVSLTNQPKP